MHQVINVEVSKHVGQRLLTIIVTNVFILQSNLRNLIFNIDLIVSKLRIKTKTRSGFCQ